MEILAETCYPQKYHKTFLKNGFGGSWGGGGAGRPILHVRLIEICTMTLSNSFKKHEWFYGVSKLN